MTLFSQLDLCLIADVKNHNCSCLSSQMFLPSKTNSAQNYKIHQPFVTCSSFGIVV